MTNNVVLGEKVELCEVMEWEETGRDWFVCEYAIELSIADVIKFLNLRTEV